MDSFIDNCLNKLKLKKFQVAKIPKKHKIPHFHHSYGDEEREDTCKIWRKENEKNIITAASIRTRLKIFEIKSPGIKHKADLCKKRAMKNLFDLIDEENKESDQVNELQPKFPSGKFIDKILITFSWNFIIFKTMQAKLQISSIDRF